MSITEEVIASISKKKGMKLKDDVVLNQFMDLFEGLRSSRQLSAV